MENITYLDPVRQDLHIIKCVVVGDSSVGKTRLICSRACGTEYTLQQLMQTHVPTVWAIDHYRKDKEVLLHSWTTIDNVPSVSLRLWDTFGYHDKDRRFAYGRADVILVCFSLVRSRTLQNVLTHWYPEIRLFCPGVPIILCGCQADLRYMYMEEEFVKMDKGPFFREINESDIVTPEMSRAVANEIDAAYYETSVLEQHGIDDVFTNVIRVALINKREKHFWNMLGNLKRISRPLCQEPFLPRKPKPPKLTVLPVDLEHDLESLLQNQAFCDVIFIARGVCIQAQKVCLVAASAIFEELFLSDLSSPPSEVCPATTSKLMRTHSHCSNGNGSFKVDNAHIHEDKGKVQSDTAKLLDFEEVETSSVDLIDVRLDQGCFPQMTLNHPAFKTLQLQYCEDVFMPGNKILQTVIMLNDDITPAAFQYILLYLYTGKCMENDDNLHDILQAAEMMGLRDLVFITNNILNNEPFLNRNAREHFLEQRMERLRDLTIRRSVLADVVFQVDDGTVAAHKALLTARCDVMLGMFSYNFRESSAKVIHFPGVTRDTFVALQQYLYTGACPEFHDVDCICIELIELANRLCLPRLLSITERYIITELVKADDQHKDVMEDVIMLLEPAQLHNANQLAEWCLWYCCVNYQTIYQRHSKLLQTLKPENQIYLAKCRWPPVWYIKELDYYEKCLVDLERERSIRGNMRRGSDDSDRGCLGFCGRTRRKLLKCDAAPVPNPAPTVVT